MKSLKQFLIVLAAMMYILGMMAAPAVAADFNIAGKTLLAQNQIFPLANPSEYGNLPAASSGQSAEYQFQELVWGLIQNVRYIIGAIAIVMIVFSGFKMVTGYGNEEVYQKQRNTILYGIIGLVVVAMSGELARIFAVSCPEYTDPTLQTYQCTQGGFLKDPNSIIRTSVIFNQQTKIIITFIKYFIGSVAVFMIVRNGFRMMTMGNDESKIALDKKNLIYSVVGLILIIVADTLVNNVFYKIDTSKYPSTGGAAPGIDAAQGVKEIVGFTNMAVSIVAPLAVLSLVAGGIMYMTAMGDDAKMGKAKKIITASIMGIVIVYAAFAIVSTFIAGRFEGTVNPSVGT
jgi:hypothetical protein